MPSMFPTMASSSDDRNRRVESWQPGDPTPRTTIAAFALLLITGVLMIVAGGFQLMAKWDGPINSPAQAEDINFLIRNVRILGGVTAACGLGIAVLAPKVRDGYRRARRAVTFIAAVGMFFMLAGWVFQFTGMGNALLALLLAVALLLAFRPAADPYFDAGHRLETPIEGDGTIPGDELRK
ncbi:putative membrane protein [Corynebacterium resistens DSM 45100]|uniref:Membrane protein n=1 Tax=Corynebacterium resistens (strain DSM 45100 / JCM 12819 / GTC 2026 / SICGH 158) TaxID=662755 RepID=F8E2S6_CORRG|nr:hypothetical protein [Corynebacterium resistens]AEI10299.1 putative membrane protein [Corynebacterium resistens DSM 45100]